MDEAVINALLREEDEKAVQNIMDILEKHHKNISRIPISELSKPYDDIRNDIREYLTEPL